MEPVIELIKSFGFPVACCLVLGWYCKYLWDMYAKAVNNMQDRYDQQLKEHHEVITNNTVALNGLMQEIEGLKEVIKDGASRS